MVTLQTADNVLKSYYLDAVSEALDFKTNPFLSKIEHTTSNVVGKDVVKVVKVANSNGVAAGSETGDLPTSMASNYVKFVSTLKNLYGTIEISDKAIRASANNEGAFVDLLNDEMQSLIKSASYNFARMLYGNGDGILSRIYSLGDDNWISVENAQNFSEGIIVDMYSLTDDYLPQCSGRTVIAVDRVNDRIKLSGEKLSSSIVLAGMPITGSKTLDQELTGLGAIFNETKELYGQTRDNPYMNPQMTVLNDEIDDLVLQKAIDDVEAASGGKINFMACTWGVRRALVENCRARGVTLPMMEVDGEQVLSFNGIPIYVDRFCQKGMFYMLNTNDFKLHQLCDWQWLQGEDGSILKQVPGKPVYTATLVKYVEMICTRPCAQGRIAGILEH